ncbi:MAG: DciA family protein [Gallionella sp.]
MTQPLKSLFNNNTEFRAILGKAELLQNLQQTFSACTPENLAHACQMLSLDYGVLTIATANATVAAKLRQLAPEITLNMKNRGAEVSGIRVKVQVSYAAPVKPGKSRELSSTAHTAIQQLSDSLSESPLKDALKKMADKHSA